MDNKLSICFMAGTVFGRASASIYGEMRRRYGKRIRGIFVTSNAQETSSMRNLLNDIDDAAKIYEVSQYFRGRWEDFSEKKLAQYEKKYMCRPIWEVIYADRFLPEYDRDYCVRTAVGFFELYEEIFYTEGCGVYFDEIVAGLQNYIAYIVGRHHGVRYFAQMPSRGGIENKYHYISSPFMDIEGFDNDYRKNEYSKEEVKRAEEFLDNFQKKTVVPFKEAQTRVKPNFKFKYLFLPIYYIKYRLNPYYNDRYYYMYYGRYKYTFDPMVFYLRYKYCKRFYRKADYSKKYVYFPLHFQPEATTLVAAPKYEKQHFLIDSLAKSISADTYLYIKEHYVALGNRTVSFYKMMKNYPNVVLIDPWESSRELIKNSEAVVTLTGTAGFESMLLEKPTIVCGNIFYENAPGVVKINDIYMNYYESLSKWEKPNRIDLVLYLCEYFRHMHKGNCDYWSPAFYEKDNIERMANILYMFATDELQIQKAKSGNFEDNRL